MYKGRLQLPVVEAVEEHLGQVVHHLPLRLRQVVELVSHQVGHGLKERQTDRQTNKDKQQTRRTRKRERKKVREREKERERERERKTRTHTQTEKGKKIELSDTNSERNTSMYLCQRIACHCLESQIK